MTTYHPGAARRARRSLGVLVAAIAGVTILSSLLTHHLVRSEQEARFERQVERLDAALAERMTAYVQVLRGGLGFFLGSDDVTRAEWAGYVDTLRLDVRYPGFKSLSYAPAVSAEGLDAFVADVRAAGDDGIGDPEALADYTLREPDGSDGDTELHGPILYVAPDTAVNRKVLGVDMMLEPQRRTAMEDAVTSGSAVVTPRLRLAGSDNAEAGFIVYVPIVKDGELKGWLTAAFLAEVFTRGLEVARDTSVEFEILDGVGEDAQLLHSTAGLAEDGGPRPLAEVDEAAFTSTSEVSVPGPRRLWQIRYAAPDDFIPLRESILPWLVLLLGLAVIGVVVVVSRSAERWRLLAVQLDDQAVGLHEAREAAVAAAVAKSTFLSTMSHEIRTPLNAIVGANSVLLETDLDHDQADYVRVIRDSGSHLVHVVNEILDLAKAEAGQVVLEQERFDLHACVGAVLDIIDGEATRKRLRVTADLDGPVWVVGDVARLRQVLINLVANAVKFTPERGEVRVKVSSDAEGMVTFEVTDTGIGIEPDQVARLFEPFVQAGAWTTRTHGGTGLGLTISRHLVEAMGGRISVESQPGRGATFRFTVLLPAADAPEADVSKAGVSKAGDASSNGTPDRPLGEIHPLRILVAEDDDLSRLLLSRMLARLGYTPIIVADGAAAVAAARWTAYDVVMLDRYMPDLDGVEAARRILELRPGADRPHIVAISGAVGGDGGFGDLADDVVPKPYSIGDLADALRRVPPSGRPVTLPGM